MNNRTTFVFATALSAGLSMAGIMLNAGTDASNSRLAAPVAIATLGGCELKGEIVEDEDGVFAVFSATRADGGDHTETVDFSYSVSFLGPFSPLSRMGPRPHVVKTGKCSMALNGTDSAVTRVPVQEHLQLVAGMDAALRPAAISATNSTVQTSSAAFQLTPAVWTLSVSRSETVAPGGWAALPPPTILKKTELGQGTIVLATRVEDAKQPETPTP